jgi:uncharacterized membrane protein YcaP (DUF421 family)
MHSISTDLFVSGIPIGEKLLRTLVVYVFMLVGLRLAGKRELSQLNPFDLVVLLLLSNTVQNAIIGNDNSLIGGVIGAAALLIMNGVLVRGLYHFGQLDKIEGRPDTLMRNGRLLRHHLERELITVSELEAAARRQGIESLAHVHECRLETGGALTFVQKKPTSDEMRQHEIIGLLAQIDARQRETAAQLAALEAKIAGTTGNKP